MDANLDSRNTRTHRTPRFLRKFDAVRTPLNVEMNLDRWGGAALGGKADCCRSCPAAREGTPGGLAATRRLLAHSLPGRAKPTPSVTTCANMLGNTDDI